MKAASSSTPSHRRPRWPLRPLALSLACIGLAPAGAQILPSGSALVGGSATVGMPSALANGGLAMGINQATSRAILNWQSFSIGALDQVNITQQMGAASVLLNRVTGAQASTIAGKLTANGHVYLVNPAGVTFAKGSQVSVGGLLASTLDIAGADDATRNATFMAGGAVNPATGRRELGFAGAADSTARIMVENGADITANAPGGTVGLLGGLVRNEGQINVARGSVGLVSASKVSLDFDGDGLTQFIVPVDGMSTSKLAGVQANPDKASLDATTTAQVMNSGAITADGGRVALVGSSTLAQQVVNHSGTVRAASMFERGGEIVLQARHGGTSGGDNQLVVTGSLNADANAAGVAGGSVRTSADDLRIRSSASISASGGAGAANGNWTAEGRRNLEVGAEDPAATGSRFITASVVGKTLGRNTNVTLSTTDEGGGTTALAFGDNAKLEKTGGGDATLRVNSLGNIDMRVGSAIGSTAGALNVEFNADSAGIAAAAPPGNPTEAAAIRVDRATIDANGGDIRFFGQGVATGRAIGGQVKGLDADSPGEYRSGIWVGDSTLSTRGAGQISLRGQGVTQGKLESFGVVVASASANAGVRAAGGSIRIDAGTSDVRLDAGVAGRALLDVSSTTGAGGSIDVDARNVLATNNGSNGPTLLADARGVGQGGNVTLHGRAQSGVAGSGIVAMDPNLSIDASAGSAVGNGGEVRLLGERSLYAFGQVAARGGSAGGNGGFIETSGGYAIPETAASGEPGYVGGGLLMSGFRADASAPAGKAGSWLIDPQNVTIQNGGATDVLPPGNPSVYVPLNDSVIQDTDISAALNGGTDVRITTGTGGAPDQGDIFMDDAQIVYNLGAGTRTLTLDAHRSVRSNAGTTIAAYGDGRPLNVVFNANANNTSPPPDGGQVSYSGNIYTNGGNVAMTGSWGNAFNRGASIGLDGEVIDTRAGNQLGVGPGGYSGGDSALAGGSVQLNGRSNFPPLPIGSVPGNQAGGVWLQGTNVRTSTGDVNIFGSSTFGSGVIIDAVAGQGGIFTTSGNVLITGVGSFVASSPYGSGHGVVIGNGNIEFTAGPTLSSVDGNIALRGVRLASGPVSGDGVQLGQRSLLTTTGSGNIEITGESQGNGAGVNFSPQLTGTFPTIPAANVAGNNNVVLRAANDGSTDALVVGTGSKVSAANVLNLRPGGLDVQGGAANYIATAVDRTAIPITLGGPTATGFSVSSDELARMTAPTLVAGSNAHAANITVAGAITTPGALTLQNGGGGGIQLNAPVSAQRLGLVSSGDITQAAGAPITAGTLLARSTAGNVLLENPANNVSASTLGGSAAGAFRYVDADTVQVGAVSVIGFDAGGNAPYVESATSMAADTVFVRTLAGDLLLGANVTSGSGADLVAAARFQNLGSYSIGGAPWRVWADTWVGETRGGLAGSAPLPNFYNCAFGGFCGVTITPGNHFIYRQQPDATVVVGNQTRPFGVPSLPFTFSVAGLILGDSGAGFSGSFSTPRTPSSLPGRYPINATFTSAEGYRVTVLPGDFFVTAALNRPLPDVLREIPQTWLYDRNVGQAPICLATGPLDGDRSAQGNDVLAREWSRVRSRPNLLSCVDTERRNGCADF